MIDYFAKRHSKKLRDNYDSIAHDFAVSRDRLWPEFAFFEKYLKNDRTVLDLACGSGRLYLFLKDKIKSYTGVDFSENLLVEARARFNDLRFLNGTLLESGIKDERFDLIFCIAGFHHLGNRKQRMESLGEIRRLLNKDGYFVFTVWNLLQKKYLRYRILAFLKFVFTFGLFHPRDFFVPWKKNNYVKRYYYAFKASELNKLLVNNGFEIVDEFGSRNGKRVDFEDCYNWCVIAKKNE